MGRLSFTQELKVFATASEGTDTNVCRRDTNADGTIARAVLELQLNLTAEQALAECDARGLIVARQRELAGRTGSSHWHLTIPGRAGTLELNEWQGRVWVKVHPLREGDWARDLAQELSRLPTRAQSGHS